MNWLTDSIWWYGVIALLGLFFLPLTRKIFTPFYDGGYPFAKTIGIITLSFIIFILGIFKIVPFTREFLIIICIVGACLNYYFFHSQKISVPQFLVFVAEESVFFIAFIVWVIIRGQEPSIHGLEKFMDFGFINSILRSQYFPPADMWLAGHPINYYYFGHLTGAVLTKLSGIASDKTYNLILATLFALGITETFSLTFNAIYHGCKKHFNLAVLGGVLGSFIVNLAGNLHTIYLFTTGYPNENPVPFWKILSSFNPQKYWYPNATRFIPFTIHEFPIYSYVVADLHGHVFDIPFVLTTLAILLTLTIHIKNTLKSPLSLFDFTRIKNLIEKNRITLLYSSIVGFMCAIHYMTNAWDGFIYFLLTAILFFIFFGLSDLFLISCGVAFATFMLCVLPFSSHFVPFVSAIGVNCSPEFLVNAKKIGPFLFEKGNCQVSAPWMLFVLWGFFLIHFVFFSLIFFKKIHIKDKILQFVFVLFSLSTFLLIIPEFFYLKDIYPQHFRANTMFKLGYQAFMMMGIASSFTFILYKTLQKEVKKLFVIYIATFIVIFSLIAFYPSFAITSYYGKLDKTPVLDGSLWVSDSYPDYKEVITYFNTKIVGQPVILEAQGDSYTDFDLVSSYTGLPTIGGWWVHEWLWHGTPQIIGDLIPDIQAIFESTDIQLTTNLIQKYHIKYIVVGPNEKQKYTKLNEEKFTRVGSLLFRSKNGGASIYKTN
jgi:uncharacterized membrane protein